MIDHRTEKLSVKDESALQLAQTRTFDEMRRARFGGERAITLDLHTGAIVKAKAKAKADPLPSVGE